MNDIKQLTNLDLQYYTAEDRTVFVTPTEQKTIPYYEIELENGVHKIGYCCEPKGDSFPIFLTFSDGAEKTFYVSKGGMYEFQPEEYKDISRIDDEDFNPEVNTAELTLIKVAVPGGIQFTFDYVAYL